MSEKIIVSQEQFEILESVERQKVDDYAAYLKTIEHHNEEVRGNLVKAIQLMAENNALFAPQQTKRDWQKTLHNQRLLRNRKVSP